MSGVFRFAILAMVLLAAVPVVLLSLQCLLSLLPYRKQQTGTACKRPSVAILVPAHNEESMISLTIEGIRPQLGDGDRLLVVADNCTDHTARVAAQAGAQVIERHNATQRGKGFAARAWRGGACGHRRPVL